MGLLKSVIADARPAKSMQRVQASAASVAGQLPAALSSNHGHTKSADNRTHGFTKTAIKPADKAENTKKQHVDTALTAPDSMRQKRHTETSRQIKQGTAIHSKAVLPQQTTKHADDAGKPSARTEQLAESERLLRSHPDVPAVSLTPHNIDADSSVAPAAARKPLQQKLQHDAFAHTVAEKPSAGIPQAAYIEADEPSLKLQTPMQAAVSKQLPDAPPGSFSSIAGNDERVTASGADVNRLVAKSTNHGDDDLSQHANSGEENTPTIPNQRDNSQQSTSKGQFNSETVGFPESGHDDYQLPRNNTLFKLAEKKEPQSDSETDENSLVEVGARLQNLQSELRQQKDKETTAQMTTARTGIMTVNPLVNEPAASQHLKNSVQISHESPQVRIGQVDVFIDNRSVPSPSAGRSMRPSVSMASRHYLRRL